MTLSPDAPKHNSESSPGGSADTDKNTSNAPIDQEARRAAISPEGSFAVAAPAGSGKTGLLTQRVLSLLAISEHPEEVLSITFTRKAATEMQHRINAAIQHAAEEENEPENPHDAFTWRLAKDVLKRDAQKQWQILQAPNRIRVQTIDGFCRSLARQLPLASGLGALPDTLEQPALAYGQAVSELFEQMESDESLFKHWQIVLEYLDNKLPQLQQLMVGLLAKRDQWLPTLHPLFVAELQGGSEALEDFNGISLRHWIEEILIDLQANLAPEASELASLADYASSNLANEGKTTLAQLQGLCALPSTQAEDLIQWQQLAHLLTTATGWRKKLDKNIGFISPKVKAEKQAADMRKQQFHACVAQLVEHEGLLEKLQLIKQFPSVGSTPELQAIMSSLSYLLVLVCAQLKVVFRRLGATDFIEVGQAALQALGDSDEPSDIALTLDYQIRHILVDEFQDTAQPQLQLLEKLTAGWENGDGRSLFIVGDGMQSCYSFRDANVGLFLQARAQGIGDVGLQALDLQVNFRSQTNIVEWVNDAFSQAFPAADDIGRGAVQYAQSVAFKPALEQTACETEIFAIPPEASSKLGASLQGAALAEKVAHIRKHNPDDSVAILVRNRSHLREVLPELERRGLKWQATDIDPLASRMAIQDLMSLCKAMLFPSDRIAFLSLLRSPLLGLDLKELWLLSNFFDSCDDEVTDTESIERLSDGFGRPVLSRVFSKQESWEFLENSTRKRLKTFSRHWLQAQENNGRKPLRIWLEGLWLDLGGPATLLAASDLKNVDSFFSLLEREGWILESWSEFEQKVERLYARPDVDADPKLQVMTIHKSKGLEFDHVFIPGLERSPRSNESELLMWMQRLNHKGHNDLFLAPLASQAFGAQAKQKTAQQQSNALYQLLRDEEKLKLDYEATRLLYVGCTRAIKHLYLYASLKTQASDTEEPNPAAQSAFGIEQLKAPTKSSLLAKIWPTVQQQAKVTGPTPQHIRQDFSAESSPHAATNSDPASEAHISRDFSLRLSDAWRAPPAPSSELLAAFRGREFADEDNTPEPYRAEQLFYRHLGTIMHRALRQLCLEGLEYWTKDRINRQKSIWQRQLQQAGLWPEGAEQASNVIEKAILLCLDDKTGRWLLDHTHRGSQCEWRLWHPSQGREYIIDRSFVSDGTRWIIDYKSSLPSADQSIEEFVAQEWDQYRQQLEAYEALLKDYGNEPSKAALYFPLIQHFALDPSCDANTE